MVGHRAMMMMIHHFIIILKLTDRILNFSHFVHFVRSLAFLAQVRLLRKSSVRKLFKLTSISSAHKFDDKTTNNNNHLLFTCLYMISSVPFVVHPITRNRKGNKMCVENFFHYMPIFLLNFATNVTLVLLLLSSLSSLNLMFRKSELNSNFTADSQPNWTTGHGHGHYPVIQMNMCVYYMSCYICLVR